MMERFEICFPLPGTESRTDDKQYLVPHRLPESEPSTGNWDNALAFEYHYTDALPTTVISRFIVQMHKMVHQKTWWRTGAVLQENEETRALVRSFPTEKRIEILVVGSDVQRRLFLAKIRHTFDQIHQGYEGFQEENKIREMMPVPGHPTLPRVSYQDLIKKEGMGETYHIPDGLNERIPISDFLNGIISPEDRRRQGKTEQRKEDEKPSEPPKSAPIPVPKDPKDELRVYQDNRAKILATRWYRLSWLLAGILVLFWPASILYLGWQDTLKEHRKFSQIIAIGKEGWNSMEAWTYMIPILGLALTYFYYAVALRTPSLAAFREGLEKQYRKRLYKEAGLGEPDSEETITPKP
jgi:hypothetical protein